MVLGLGMVTMAISRDESWREYEACCGPLSDMHG